MGNHFQGLSRASRGFSLIETLIALGIFGAIGVTFMAALASNYRATDIVDERVRAENVAPSVLEDIRSQPYLDSYTVLVTPPQGYSFTIITAPFCSPKPCTPDNKIQKNTVNVFENGQRLTELSDLKARRSPRSWQTLTPGILSKPQWLHLMLAPLPKNTVCPPHLAVKFAVAYRFHLRPPF